MFLIFVLARYDGSDAGAFTGLSCLLWRVGILSTSFVEGWELLQGVYLVLPLMAVIDWRVMRATKMDPNKKSTVDHDAHGLRIR